MRIKYIRTQNIQSHKDVLIEFPEEGVVVLCGDNSSGKSVIRRTLQFILDGSIGNSSKRCPLIRRNEPFGEIEIEADTGLYFKAHIAIEASDTYGLLRYPDGTEVKRYLRDKVISDMLKEFNFHYNADRDISLTIRNTDDGMPFVNTSPVVNGDLLSSALVDEQAELKIASLKDHIMSVRSAMEQALMEINASETILNSIVITDEEADMQVYRKCIKAYDILSHFYTPKLEFDLPNVPNVPLLEIYKPRIKKIKTPLAIEVYKPTLLNLEKLQKEVETIEKGVCPTCHQSLCNCII